MGYKFLSCLQNSVDFLKVSLDPFGISPRISLSLFKIISKCCKISHHGTACNKLLAPSM